MKNFLKRIGVGIAFTFAWTYLYFYWGLGLSLPLIGKLSDFDREPPIAVRISMLLMQHAIYWIVLGLLFVLAFWLTRARNAKAKG